MKLLMQMNNNNDNKYNLPSKHLPRPLSDARIKQLVLFYCILGSCLTQPEAIPRYHQ